MTRPAGDDLAAPKFALLIAATISVIRRAVRFLSVSNCQFTLSVPAAAFHAVEPQGRRHDAHGVHEVVHGNAFEHLDVLEHLFGHRRSGLAALLRGQRERP